MINDLVLIFSFSLVLHPSFGVLLVDGYFVLRGFMCACVINFPRSARDTTSLYFSYQTRITSVAVALVHYRSH